MLARRPDGGVKVAVTGAAGHLGQLLVPALMNAGHDVRAVVHTRPMHFACDSRVADIRDEAAVNDALAGMDVVVHLAAKISLHTRDAALMMATQVEGTRNVVNAARRLIHVASIHAYDPRPLEVAVDEARPLATDARHFAYDRSKALAAKIVLEAIAGGLDAIVVSPTALLGPDDFGPSEIGALFGKLLRRELPGLVDASFDWVDARDVVAQLVRLLDGAPSRHYILPGHRASLVELGRTVCELGHVKPPAMTSPLWLAKATVPFAGAWGKLTKKEPLYTSASLATLGHYLHVDGARAQRELAWAPRPLHETLVDTVAWWKSRP